MTTTLSGYRDLEPAWQWTHDDGSDARARVRSMRVCFPGTGNPMTDAAR